MTTCPKCQSNKIGETKMNVSLELFKLDERVACRITVQEPIKHMLLVDKQENYEKVLANAAEYLVVLWKEIQNDNMSKV